jgi:hypothetical protein
MTLTTVGKAKDIVAVWKNDKSEAEEVMAFCHQCKALQTIWLNGSTMMPTQKFTQEGNQIYHNCGSRQPCKLYYEQ